MISDNQTCAEFKSALPKDWPHLALSVHHEEETKFDLPTDEEHVDNICAKKPKHVVLQYTTIDIETVPGSSTETIEAIEYQEKWEKDVEGWFKRSNYEPAGHTTLDSEPIFNCEQGIERFAAYGRLDHRIYAWRMRQELKGSTATLSRHHWVFEMYCAACDRYQHDCKRKCTMKTDRKQCGKTFNGDLNLRRHHKSHHGCFTTNPNWCGHEVRVMYNLHLLGYSVSDISKDIPGRCEETLRSAINAPMYGCPSCQNVYRACSLFQRHSATTHGVTPTCYHCYKCNKIHELRDWGPCLGEQRKLDLRDREEMNAFYEMQLGFLFLAQLKRSDNPRFWQLPNYSHTRRSEFLSQLCKLLWSTIQCGEFADTLEQRMLTQLLGVVQCEEEFVSQGKGDGVIDVASGNLGWYRKLRSKARDREERPLLSATEMGLAV